ncbi:uncharacterized protein LOC115736453 [Rhodamnia argentea]|uniref:Uncharacterized protein LOC115736453 n=1 Tax=Rhodamnia argentea TaxID=178133 RepID=A0ABM3GWB9_9MYRT|nr:uncharacterized protein LOC115736453 [Rhodamnia argentea]
MSRCFPYPPPGYARNGVRDKALIESIKREVEKAKKERRKERKLEKNEKKKALENGKKALENVGIKDKKKSHKRRNEGKRTQGDQKAGDRDHRKKRKHDTEHFERSNLTEEHGKPVNSLNSTDSTMNSSKKQKQILPPDCGHNPASIIRIRLPLQRHKDPEMLPSGEQPCSAPVRTDLFGHENHEHAPRSSTDQRECPCSTSPSLGEGSASKLGSTEQRPSSGIAETSSRKNGTLSSPSFDDRGLSPSELKYRNLIENWVPPSFGSGCADLDDQEWLFDRKQLNCDGGCKADYDGLTCGSPSPWPRMHYLPEVDMYALPYTVPY